MVGMKPTLCLAGRLSKPRKRRGKNHIIRNAAMEDLLGMLGRPLRMLARFVL
jgi:hypothetical protein